MLQKIIKGDRYEIVRSVITLLLRQENGRRRLLEECQHRGIPNL